MFSPFVYCRPGFESEAEQELSSIASRLGIPASRTLCFVPGAVLLSSKEAQRQTIQHGFDFHNICFARQLMFAIAIIDKLPQRDKLTPIVAALQAHSSLSELTTDSLRVEVEVAPENPTPGIVNFTKSIYRPFCRAIETLGVKIGAESTTVLHLFFASYDTAILALSFRQNSSPWRLGIPRLKFPPAAPSRSTLKLDEAIQVFIPANRRDTLLRSGMRAVDLGAAPGGWSFQFVERGIHVTAVDNGQIDHKLMESGLVSHITADAFKFRPQRPVDWMVCDVVEQPVRIAELVGFWLKNSLCKRTIFNLKLPMKRRYDEILRCEQIILDAAPGSTIHKKQLYHDREEITCFIERDL